MIKAQMISIALSLILALSMRREIKALVKVIKDGDIHSEIIGKWNGFEVY